MNSEQARQILRLYRPNGADRSNPDFAEALKIAERDPALQQWLQDQQAFDRPLATALAGVPIPQGLRETLLHRRKPAPTPWWQHPLGLAAAAAVITLFSIANILIQREPLTPTAFKNNIVTELWNADTHLDFESSDLEQIRTWLTRQGADSQFNFPEALQDLPIVGCRLLRCDGHQGVALCLRKDGQHTHLAVMNTGTFAHQFHTPSPDFDDCQGWVTASWTHDNRFYVVSGMPLWTFIKRFHTNGRWSWLGWRGTENELPNRRHRPDDARSALITRTEPSPSPGVTQDRRSPLS